MKFVRKRRHLGLLFVSVSVGMAPVGTADTVVYTEGFEFGWGLWSASNGVWDIGAPSSGPGTAFAGQFLAGTNLSGNYPDNASTRLESPAILLPGNLATTESLKLKFRYWIAMHLSTSSGSDTVTLEIHDGTSWMPIDTYWAPSSIWTQGTADLTPFAGSNIRLGWRLKTGSAGTGPGMFLDEVRIERGSPLNPNPENFESGDGDWGASNGIWQIGVPTAGPATVPSGTHCAATNLSGNYWDIATTRLVSPTYELTPKAGEIPALRFAHWFSLHPSTSSGSDSGVVQILPAGGSWTSLKTFNNDSSGWTSVVIDLSPYAGQTVKIGFLLTTGSAGTAPGWYVDNVEILGIQGHCDVSFTGLGGGTAGSGGIVPSFQGGAGSCIGGYVGGVSKALGGAPIILVVGSQSSPAPLLGGTFFVDLSGPHWIDLYTLFGTDGAAGGGFLNFVGGDVTSFPFPNLYTQGFVMDPLAPYGIAFTNGLKMTIQ